MADDDWYRRTTWQAEDKEAFYARLKRSRSTYNKAQYLRIQAGYLHRPDAPELIEAALQLLDELVARYPEESELAQAQLQRAECFDSLDRPLEAVAAYRLCVAAQRAYPNALTVVPAEFGLFCVRRNLESLFDEAIGYLDEFPDESRFPTDVFKENAVRAVVADRRGDSSAAATFAAAALQAADRTDSGYRYHPHVGLVGSEQTDLITRLTALAERRS